MATLGGNSSDHGGTEKEQALVAATQELERSFNKADFLKMQVVGQFNLGFILARLDQDMFIIDQHASDEKFNFERLSKSTILNRQPLVRPLPLDLSAAEEVTILTHMETFRRNGFDFVEFEDAPPGQRLRLSAVPFSQNTTFGIGDVHELVSLLADKPVPSWHQAEPAVGSEESQLSGGGKRPPGTSNGCQVAEWSTVRPSRVRAMLASRACRSSIMIGSNLSKHQMERIVKHLAELDSPWNCPHGRPTMRHLVDLSSLSIPK